MRSRNLSSALCVVILAGSLSPALLARPARGATVAYSVDRVATTAGPGSGLEVTLGQPFVGTSSFDETDVTPDGYPFLAVPESSTGLLLALGLVALGVTRKYRTRRQP